VRIAEKPRNGVVLLLVAGVVLTAGCRHETPEETDTTAAAPVKVLKAEPNTFQAVVAASGVVAAAPGADWTITAPEAARIVEMPKAEGDRVITGDLLVRFEIPSLQTDVATRQAEFRTAQAAVTNAQANVTRLTTLVQHGVAAQKELEDAQRQLAEAQASVAQAESALANARQLESRTVVRARFSGVVAKRSHNPGDMVDASASDVILRVIDPSRLQAVASVAVADLPRVVVGKPVSIDVPGVEEPETGKVLTRPAAVGQSGISADVRIAFDKPTRLAVGTPVRVEITAEQHPNALAVPVTAVLHEDADTFVMLAGADNKAHKQKVTVGLTTAKLAEITSGLKAGDNVIVEGQQELPDGAAISATTASAAESK
jgi:RND family efflux transporter MFP subunit